MHAVIYCKTELPLFFNLQQDACTGVRITPPADEKKMGTHNLDICVLCRLRLRQGQMQGFLGLQVGGGGS